MMRMRFVTLTSSKLFTKSSASCLDRPNLPQKQI
jgi:hypothetical protein